MQLAGPEGSRRALGVLLVALGAFALSAIGCVPKDALPATAPTGYVEPADLAQKSIERREICVGSAVASAGTLGETLYYRAAVLPDGKLVVGYFAFFSQERPWGNNWMTWTVVPALAIDMVYTRTAFVGPGLQRALSGKGDVEGFRIVYEPRPDGTLDVERAVADDGSHRIVELGAAEVLAMDPERPTLYSRVWSHQLGGRGLHSMAALARVHCFGRGSVLPLPERVVAEFGLGHRAAPAHVEALGGRMLGTQSL